MDATIISIIRNNLLTPEQAAQQIKEHVNALKVSRVAQMVSSLPAPKIEIETTSEESQTP